jgi:hypothetical protein
MQGRTPVFVDPGVRRDDDIFSTASAQVCQHLSFPRTAMRESGNPSFVGLSLPAPIDNTARVKSLSPSSGQHFFADGRQGPNRHH